MATLRSTSPRSKLIADLRRRIETRQYHEGQLLPSEREIAAAFSMSRTTVRAALDELVQSGLIEHVDHRQRRIASRSALSGVVAVFTDFGADAWRLGQGKRGWNTFTYLEMMRHLQNAGRHVLSVSTGTSGAGEARRVLAGRPDCAMLTIEAALSERGHEIVDECEACRVPLVAYGDELEGRCPCVASDHEAGAYQLTKWMIERGRRRLVQLWTMDESPRWLGARERGHERAMREAGLQPLRPIRVPPLPSQDHAERATWPWFEREVTQVAGTLVPLLTSGSRPDGILAVTDPAAREVIAALRRFGVAPNHDVWVAGYDNAVADGGQHPFESEPPCVTVDKQNDLIGQELAKLLLARAASPEYAQACLRVPPKLVVVRDPSGSV